MTSDHFWIFNFGLFIIIIIIMIVLLFLLLESSVFVDLIKS